MEVLAVLKMYETTCFTHTSCHACITGLPNTCHTIACSSTSHCHTASLLLPRVCHSFGSTTATPLPRFSSIIATLPFYCCHRVAMFFLFHCHDGCSTLVMVMITVYRVVQCSTKRFAGCQQSQLCVFFHVLSICALRMELR